MDHPDLPECILTAPLPPEFGCNVCGKQPHKQLVLLPCYHLVCNECLSSGCLAFQEGLNMPDLRSASPATTAPVSQLLRDRTANIAVVGSQGTGKSKLISRLTGRHVRSGPGMCAITQGWGSYRAPDARGVAWWDSSGMQSWSHWEASRLIRSIARLEGAGTTFDLVVVVLRASERPNKPALFEFLERLRKAKKRFVVVTTAMGSVEDKDWDTIKAEKRRLMQAFGRPTELNAHADAFISAAGKVALFSCHIDSVKPVQGINELLLCVLASLPRNRVASVGRSLAADRRAGGGHQDELTELLMQAFHGLASSPAVAGALLVVILLLHASMKATLQ